MSPEETCHQAMPPRGAVDATGHPWPNTKATSKLLNLRFARTDHATAVIEFGWLRVAAVHHSERSRLFDGPVLGNVTRRSRFGQRYLAAVRPSMMQRFAESGFKPVNVDGEVVHAMLRLPVVVGTRLNVTWSVRTRRVHKG
jgi:hypothetical protein